MRFESQQGRRSLPPVWKGRLSLLVVPLAFFWLEVMLRVTAHLGATHLFGALLIAISSGMLVNLISTLSFSGKVNFWIAFGLTELCTIWFLIAHFTNASYQVFMDLQSIFVGAGDVVNGFGDTVLSVIVSGVPVILLYHVPSILMLIFRKKLRFRHENLEQTILLAALWLAFWPLSSVAMTRTPADVSKYRSEYTYDTAMRSFGGLTALRLDARQLLFGEKESGFDPAPQISDLPDPDLPDDSGEDSAPAEDPEVTEDPPVVEPPKEYGWNQLDLDFAALAEAESNQKIKELHQYVASLQPSRQNEYTGLFKGKNLILITAEAFSAEVVDPVRTPTLYRLVNRGIVFEDYYQPAWGGSTSTGEYSVLTGLVPGNGVKSIRDTIGHDLTPTIGNQLQKLGYFSRAYHDGSYTYYHRNETHTGFGYEQFIGMGNGMEEGVTNRWPESDLEMMQFTMDQYIDHQPFSVYYMTVSGHCLYARTGNAMTKKNWDELGEMTCSDQVKGYLAANQELEKAMTYLVERLEQEGIAEDTVICLSTDHYPYGLEKSPTWGNDQDYLSELYGYPADTCIARDHSAMILWSGCLENLEEPIRVSSPTYSLDILPTLCNLFGVSYDSRLLVGRDVLSEEEPIVVWGDYSWKTDLGTYTKGNFTPKDGVEVEEGYVSRIKSIVKNKIAFSKSALSEDYYSYLF